MKYLSGLLHPVLSVIALVSIAATVSASDADTLCRNCAHTEIQALQKLRSQYEELDGNGGWPVWPAGKKLIPGMPDKRVPILREILIITGDYPSASGIPATSQRYDDRLVSAARHFQARHGLNPDGRLGKSSQAALQVTVRQRIAQIDATLKAMQAHPLAPEPKYVLINLPAYTLYAVQDGHAALVMRVIIGNRRNHTPLFDNEITDVVFNPSWHVPARIARNELMQKLHDNPDYFIHAGFIVSQDGTPVDPHTASQSDGDYAFRQRPGKGNALGKIKFNIPDSDSIYLHSTSTPKLFASEDRALSHGCIRLEKPRDLAYFVFGGNDHWDTKKIDHAYDGNQERSVPVTPVPVHLVYWTAFVDANGVAHFYDDVYGKNKPFMEARASRLLLASLK